MNIAVGYLSLKAVRALNAALEARGLRVCRVCQGKPLPLDEAHFYRRTNGKLDAQCKSCARRAVQKRQRVRRLTDEAYRQRQRESSLAWKRSHAAELREYDRRRAPRRKAAAFAAVLAVALPATAADNAAQQRQGAER